MTKVYWDEIEGIGKIYIENELVVGKEVILFVCKDDESNKYLFMTYDSYEGVYVYRKITNYELIDMLTNNVTLEYTFRNTDYIYKTYVNDEDNFKVNKTKAQDFPADMLPDKGVYFELDLEYIRKYIQDLSNENLAATLDYNFFDKISEIVIDNIKNVLIDYSVKYQTSFKQYIKNNKQSENLKVEYIEQNETIDNTFTNEITFSIAA